MKYYVTAFCIILACMIAIPALSISKKTDEEIIIERKNNKFASSQTAKDKQADSAKVFKLFDSNTNKVIEISEKDYLTGTILGEMYFEFHIEAYKAQAVAAYTNALRYQKANKEKLNESLQGADFEISTDGKSGFLTKDMAKERYGNNFEEAWKKASEAAENVYGYVMNYNGSLIQAAYHSISSGKTEDAVNVWNGSVKYLSPVKSEGDSLDKGYKTTESFTAEEIARRLKENSEDIVLDDKRETWFSNEKKTDSETVTEITVGNKVFKGSEIREMFGLRSACFEVSFKNDIFTFNVLGYGHNVGMSQSGANYMAQNGSGWQDILKHYYTGVTIEAG